MKIHDIINEAVSRAEAEKLWSTEIVKPRSAPVATLSTSEPPAKHIIRKDEPAAVIAPKVQVKQNQNIIKQNN